MGFQEKSRSLLGRVQFLKSIFFFGGGGGGAPACTQRTLINKQKEETKA